MDGKIKYAHNDKELLVTLTPCNEGGYDFVVIGDDKLVSDEELMSMAVGDSPKGWSKQ